MLPSVCGTQKTSLGVNPWASFTLLFETVYLTGPGDCHIVWTGWVSSNPNVSYGLHLTSTGLWALCHAWIAYVGSALQTQVLLLVW